MNKMRDRSDTNQQKGFEQVFLRKEEKGTLRKLRKKGHRLAKRLDEKFCKRERE